MAKQQAGHYKLAYGTHPLQFGELYLPAQSGPHPLVILIHGGFWRAAYGLNLMNGLAVDLAGHGIAAWNIEYRRVGDVGGGWPNTLLDVAQAADFIETTATTYHLDTQRIIAVGHSAGGHLALWLAARARIPQDSPLAPQGKPLALKGAVSQAGAIDLELVWQLKLGRGAASELLSGSPQEEPARYQAASPAALLPLGIPQVLVYGTADDNVPALVSRTYAKKAQAAGDTIILKELPGADHFVIIDAQSTAWSLTRAEIAKLLRAV